MSIKALFSHKDIFTRGGFPIFNYLKDEKKSKSIMNLLKYTSKKLQPYLASNGIGLSHVGKGCG